MLWRKYTKGVLKKNGLTTPTREAHPACGVASPALGPTNEDVTETLMTTTAPVFTVNLYICECIHSYKPTLTVGATFGGGTVLL